MVWHLSRQILNPSSSSERSVLYMKDTPMLINVDNTPLTFNPETEISSFTEESSIKPKRKKIEHSLLPIAGALIFGVVYTLPMMSSYPTAHSCLAILCSVAFLWGTEGIPAYATAYLVPTLSVWLGVGVDEETHLRLDASKLASEFASKFMDPIIFVFLGSMTMSECLAKLNVTDRVSKFVFKHLSKKPMFILLTLMMLNLFIAAFLSNVASTTLILTFTMPIIRSLDPDDPFIKALLFGIAWSGNCGGMPTTIASPQNILAVKAMKENNVNVSFLEWMYFGFPSAILICMCEWSYLILRYRPQRKEIKVVETDEPQYEAWSIKHTYACAITLLTIVLWTLEETFPNIFGHVGITSLIPVICFFGSGMLSVSDFHSIRWSTLALMGGGLALGEAMDVSGLLDLIGKISPFLAKIPVWPLLFIFLLVDGLLGSLINSTSAASILYPVIAKLSERTGHSTLFVSLSALMISGAQLFHISSFPNALMSGVCRHIIGCPDQVTQETFLKGSEFFLVGWPTIFLAALIISSIGYGISLSLQF